jgi:hypothetical protein
MIRKICIWLGYPLAFIFVCIIAIPIRDWLESSLGTGATTTILFLWLVYFVYIIIIQSMRAFARFAIGVSILFLTLCILIICYNNLPEQKYNRALENSRQLQYAIDRGLHKAERSEYKNDKDYFDAVENAKNEEKAVLLELEIAELRNYPSYHSYGTKPWMKIGFISAIGLMLAYGICWLIVEYKEFGIEAKQKPNRI